MEKTGGVKKQSFMAGALLLGVSNILVKLIGTLYRIPMTNILGTEGMGIYQKAYPIYATLLVLSTSGIPTAISKTVSEHFSQGDAAGARRVFAVALRLLALVGGVTALRDVDLTIDRGDYVAIVGRSGSGKSTLLHLLGLLDRPTEGTYLLDGIRTDGIDDRRRAQLRAERIGFVFQSFHLVAHTSVVDNVMLGGLYTGRSVRERRAVAEQMIDRVGLSARRLARPQVLSGGERQRVAIARALVNSPALLLADEPTGNLDSATATDVLELFGELHANGATVVLITHDAEVAARADRVVRIADGRIEP